MGSRLVARWPSFVSALALLACKFEPDRAERRPQALESAPPPTLGERAPPRPVSSAVVAVEKQLQASRLQLPPRIEHRPQLALGKGVLAVLGAGELRVYDTNEPQLLSTQPLEAPRALVMLADGSVLAVGAEACLRWEPASKRTTRLPRLSLLPGAELYADAQRADVAWVYERGTELRSARLSSFRLAPGELPVLAPEQVVELRGADDARLGITREGVWLYLTPGHAERFAPAGARLSSFDFERARVPSWSLPSVRLDQSFWVDADGNVERVQLTPRFARRARTALGGSVFSAGVGDQGRLLAAVVITGPGPRFELQLLDSELQPTGRALLPSETPTGADDWVQVVSHNQALALSEREPRVAVGGPERTTIFDATGKVILSIPFR